MTDHATDLTPTIDELLPKHKATWNQFTKTALYVAVANAALLVALLFFFVIL
ncbi:MAG: aa3-type cytochrome c oxidase subunit IV [Alphaproteobacteria bacterium]